MTTTPGDEERKQRILANGLDCLRRLHGDQTWEDWMGTGEAMMVITENALAAVGATAWDKDNKKLVKEFNRRWDEYEAGAGSNQKLLSKQERASLRFVMTNPEVGAFRAGLMGPDKRRLNHPNAVINRWRFSLRARVTRTTPSSPKREMKVEPDIDRNTLAKELAQAKARIAELEQAKAGADLDARVLKAKYAALEVEFRELRTMDMSRYGADVAAFKSEIAALKARSKASKAIQSHHGGVFTPAEDSKITMCLHPDTRASITDKERDEAFRIYNEHRDVLVKKGELPASSILPSTQQEWDAARTRASQERKAKRATRRDHRPAASPRPPRGLLPKS
jgi:hypothetical protein